MTSIHAAIPLAPAVSPSARLRLEEVTTAAALQALASDWAALADLADSSVLFNRPEWVLPWLSSYAEGRSLRVSCAYRGAQLVGLLPLLGTRDLTCFENDHTPETGMLLHPAHRYEVLGALLDRMEDRRAAISCVSLGRLPACSETARVLDALVRERRFFLHETSHGRARHTRVAGSFEVFAHAQGKNFRKQVKRAEKARLDHGLRVELISTTDQLAIALPELARVSLASWQGKKGTGAFAPTGDARFYRDVADRFARAGRLRLFVCMAGRACVGYVLCLAGARALEALKSEFDESLADHMVGWQIYRAMYEHAAASGLEDINSGSWTTEFKDRWSTHEIELLDVTVFPPTIPGSLRFLPRLGKELVKRIAGRPSVARCYPLLDGAHAGQATSAQDGGSVTETPRPPGSRAR